MAVTIKILAKDKATRVIKETKAALRSLANQGLLVVSRAAKRVAQAIGVAVVGALTAATFKAGKFQQTMAEVNTLLSTEGRQSFAAMTSQVLDLSEALPQTADDLGAGLYQTLSAGVSAGADAMGVLEVSARAAVAGLSDTFTSVDAITTILNSYGLEAERAEQVSDIMFETVRQGKINFSQLASEIGVVANSASLAGVSFEEVAAAIATMTKNGVNAAETTTALNRLLLGILSPQEGAAEAARALGVEWNIAGLQALGFQGLLRQLNDAAGDDVVALQAVVGDIRSFKAAAVIAGKGAAEFQRQVENMRNSGGAASAAFEIMNATLTNTWQLFRNRVNRILIEVGTRALPTLIARLEDAEGPLGTLRESLLGNGDAMAGFVTGAGEVVTAMTTMITWAGRLTVALAEVANTWADMLSPQRMWERAIRETLPPMESQLDMARQLIGLGNRHRTVLASLAEAQARSQETTLQRGGRGELFEMPTPEALTAALEAADLQVQADALVAIMEEIARRMSRAQEEGSAAPAGSNAPIGGTAPVTPAPTLADRIEAMGPAAEMGNLQLQAIKSSLEEIARLEAAVAFADTTEDRVAAEQRLAEAKISTRDQVVQLGRQLLAVSGSGELVNQTLEDLIGLERELGGMAGLTAGQNAELLAIQSSLEEIARLEVAVAFADTSADRTAAERALAAAKASTRDEVMALGRELLATGGNTEVVNQAMEELLGLVGELGDAADLTFGQRLAVNLQSGLAGVNELSSVVSDMVTTFLDDFGGAIATVFSAMVDGSQSAGQAFKGAMLGALAAVASAFGQFFLGQAIASVASIFGPIPNPGGAAAAAKWTAAATAMFALSGVLGGLANSGTGGGGGGGSTNLQGTQNTLSGAAQDDRELTVFIDGDLSDYRNQQRLARTLARATGRHVTIRGGRAGFGTVVGS